MASRFVSGTLPITHKKRKYKVTGVWSDPQRDLFDKEWFHFKYSSEDGEVIHPTPFQSYGAALEGGRRYVEFINA